MDLLKELDKEAPEQTGADLHNFAATLYPICRSITGDGIRETLAAIAQRIPLCLTELASGTQVFDWTIPREWNVREAYIKDSQGDRVVDFQRSNLHLMSYSVPVKATMSLSELQPHLFTVPDKPDCIPYRTSYYQENWGFCLSHNQALSLADGKYEVSIDTTLEDGNLTYAECYLPGKRSDEILISCHACHPSLANDNLSGIVVATFLAKLLADQDRLYSYRFLFVPGTIGAIAWLAQNRDTAHRVCNGLVLAGIGDKGKFHYKNSRRGDAEIDRVAAHVLRHSSESFEILDFSPYGYDERQYCSPGFNLPVGCLMRSVWGTFPEYHTSADNLDFISAEKLAASLRVCVSIVDVIENNRTYVNQNAYCEPQLGKRNLYRSTGGENLEDQLLARLWVLNLSDGKHSLLDIAERSGLRFATIRDAADLLDIESLLSEKPS